MSATCVLASRGYGVTARSVMGASYLTLGGFTIITGVACIRDGNGIGPAPWVQLLILFPEGVQLALLAWTYVNCDSEAWYVAANCAMIPYTLALAAASMYAEDVLEPISIAEYHARWSHYGLMQLLVTIYFLAIVTSWYRFRQQILPKLVKQHLDLEAGRLKKFPRQDNSLSRAQDQGPPVAPSSRVPPPTQPQPRTPPTRPPGSVAELVRDPAAEALLTHACVWAFSFGGTVSAPEASQHSHAAQMTDADAQTGCALLPCKVVITLPDADRVRECLRVIEEQADVDVVDFHLESQSPYGSDDREVDYDNVRVTVSVLLPGDLRNTVGLSLRSAASAPPSAADRESRGAEELVITEVR
eukprot:TRINITY_DN46959_c0_g1_i1.p1 TRINITY_DN46959_c0_g1~~TRINITY_DN46959_c0_g1_i1.p1  ORF type:complete len:358 (+),score=44.84 TRINITY_DN46959_c0_g1_i1:309-1382(+)